MRTTPVVALTIAGSDSGGGAGIQADLKSFAAFGVFGTSAITAITAQNTVGVRAVHAIPLDIVAAQMSAVIEDFDVRAIKIGMLATADIIEVVARTLPPDTPVVLDPVMIATSGDRLIAESAVDALKTRLIPRATCLTPNLHEAAALTERPLATTEAEMAAQGHALIERGAAAVLVKGGHGTTDESVDLLVTRAAVTRFSAPRIATRNSHGTGCSLSAAMAAAMATGMLLADAVGSAKNWLSVAIAAAAGHQLGRGHGPVDHLHDLVVPNRKAKI